MEVGGLPLKLPILSGPWSLSSEPKSSLVSGYQSSVLVVSLKGKVNLSNCLPQVPTSVMILASEYLLLF